MTNIVHLFFYLSTWMPIMPKPKINDTKLLYLIDKKRLNQSQAARELGVSRQAVSKRLQDVRGKTTKVIAVKKVEQVVDRKIDAIGQLQKINSDANEILDLLMRWSRGDKTAIQVLENQVRYIKVNGQEEPVREYKMKDPRELALKAMAEIRNQLKLQVEIFQALYSLQEVEKFQKTVIDIMGEVDPEVRKEIIRRLHAEHSIKSAIRYS
jgi:predicted transcriptional regulator